jgi:hypothetical protein
VVQEASRDLTVQIQFFPQLHLLGVVVEQDLMIQAKMVVLGVVVRLALQRELVEQEQLIKATLVEQDITLQIMIIETLQAAGVERVL